MLGCKFMWQHPGKGVSWRVGRTVRAERDVPQDVRPRALPAPGVGLAGAPRRRADRGGPPACAPGTP